MEKQTYLGVKRVEAYPEDRDGKPGYAVIYPDGYKSWSPKDVFEAAYFPSKMGGAFRTTTSRHSLMPVKWIFRSIPAR